MIVRPTYGILICPSKSFAACLVKTCVTSSARRTAALFVRAAWRICHVQWNSSAVGYDLSLHTMYANRDPTARGSERKSAFRFRWLAQRAAHSEETLLLSTVSPRCNATFQDPLVSWATKSVRHLQMFPRVTDCAAGAVSDGCCFAEMKRFISQAPVSSGTSDSIGVADKS